MLALPCQTSSSCPSHSQVTEFSLFASSIPLLSVSFPENSTSPWSPSPAYPVLFPMLPGAGGPSPASRLPWGLSDSCWVPPLLHGRDMTLGLADRGLTQTDTQLCASGGRGQEILETIYAQWDNALEGQNPPQTLDSAALQEDTVLLQRLAFGTRNLRQHWILWLSRFYFL